MKRTMIMAALFVLVAFGGVAAAVEIAVIVNKANAQNLDRGAVSKIYMGSMTRWPAGGSIKLFELSESSDLNEQFAQKVLGRSQQAVKDQWSAIVFTGKGAPPRQMPSDDDILRAVAREKNAIGYINAAKVDSSVRVVLKVH